MTDTMPGRFKIVLENIRPHLLPVLLLIIASSVVYGRILGHDFLSNWDDNRYILENHDIQGVSLERLQAIFSKYYVGNYAPVHLLSYMLDYAIWGVWAGGYLLVNLLLHTLNGILLYRLFIRLGSRILPALCGAALFLLHPVQVETVAWISQRKNLLAMLFFLLAWEFYRAYRESSALQGRLLYVASLVALLMALLSKSVAVIFPVVILLFDYCYPVSSDRPRFLDKAPYLLVSAAVAVLAVLSQTPDYSEWGAGGGRTGYHGGSAMATALTMLPVFCMYLRLIIWPTGLSALYAPEVHRSFDLAVLASLLLLGVLFLLICRFYRNDRRLAFWPLFAIIAIIPVSQIMPLVTLMNDRYLYFPMIGVAGMVAYTVNCLQQKWQRYSLAAPVIVTILLLFQSGVSFQRVSVWRNAETLWRDAVSKTPASSIAWEALGESLHYTARPNRSEAIVAYRRAIELNPVNQGGDISRYNLGVAYTELNDFANADKVFTELLKRSPDNVMGWTAFGDLSLRRFNYAEAETRYRKALLLQPEAVQVHQKIGSLMIILGRIDEARSSYLRIEEIQKASDPINAYELARLEALAGDTGASIKWLETALQRGYRDFAGIMAEEELIPVMSDGRFAELLNKYSPKQR